MIDTLRSTLLIVAGIIHLLPLSGVLGAARLKALYGLHLDNPDLLILMQHRAVMFGLVGSFLVAAAFRPDWQWLAIVAGLVSAASFILIALLVGDYAAPIRRVVVADVVAVICLIGAGLSPLLKRI